MTAGLSRFKRVTSRTLCVSIGSSVAFGLLYRSSLRVHSDSGSTEDWPKTRPLVGRTPKQPDNTIQADASPDATDTTGSMDEDVSLFEDDDSAAWASFSTRFATARRSMTSIHWSSVRDKIADRVLPEWAQALPDYVAKLQREIEMGPDSLAHEIWEEAQDTDLNPNIASAAKVRISKDLCSDELAFLERRKKHTTRSLSKYLGIPEVDIDPEDVPMIAVCGSGGGLRALVAGAASYLSIQETGLFDCATYSAGVSGSCWLQTLFNSSLGGRRHDKIIDHLKKRIGTHIAYPPSFLELLTRAPTNKYLLSGSIEKLKGDPDADFGLVDVYGLLLATRLLVPRWVSFCPSRFPPFDF